jgi:hypothetical protein
MFGKAIRLNPWMLLLAAALLMQAVAAAATRPVRFDIAAIALTLPRLTVVVVTPETQSATLAVPMSDIAPGLSEATWLRRDTLPLVLDPAPASLARALARFRARENEPQEDEQLGLKHFARADPPSDFYYERRGDDVALLMLCEQADDGPSPTCEATVNFRRAIYVTYSFARSRLPHWRDLRDGVLRYMDVIAS